MITIFAEITLRKHTTSDFAEFEQALAHHCSVTECHLIASGFDYLIKFVVTDIADYQADIEALTDAYQDIALLDSFVVCSNKYPEVVL